MNSFREISSVYKGVVFSFKSLSLYITYITIIYLNFVASFTKR